MKNQWNACAVFSIGVLSIFSALPTGARARGEDSRRNLGSQDRRLAELAQRQAGQSRRAAGQRFARTRFSVCRRSQNAEYLHCAQRAGRVVVRKPAQQGRNQRCGAVIQRKHSVRPSVWHHGNYPGQNRGLEFRCAAENRNSHGAADRKRSSAVHPKRQSRQTAGREQAHRRNRTAIRAGRGPSARNPPAIPPCPTDRCRHGFGRPQRFGESLRVRRNGQTAFGRPIFPSLLGTRCG